VALLPRGAYCLSPLLKTNFFLYSRLKLMLMTRWLREKREMPARFTAERTFDPHKNKLFTTRKKTSSNVKCFNYVCFDNYRAGSMAMCVGTFFNFSLDGHLINFVFSLSHSHHEQIPRKFPSRSLGYTRVKATRRNSSASFTPIHSQR
jgi:hypothetical protein